MQAIRQRTPASSRGHRARSSFLAPASCEKPPACAVGSVTGHARRPAGVRQVSGTCPRPRWFPRAGRSSVESHDQVLDQVLLRLHDLLH